MNRFKEGDAVICIADKWYPLQMLEEPRSDERYPQQGKTYHVRDTLNTPELRGITVKEIVNPKRYPFDSTNHGPVLIETFFAEEAFSPLLAEYVSVEQEEEISDLQPA